MVVAVVVVVIALKAVVIVVVDEVAVAQGLIKIGRWWVMITKVSRLSLTSLVGVR